MEPRDIVGSYELKWRLGEGASSIVWLGQHKETRGKAAVKQFRSELTPEHRESLIFEARVLSRLQHQHLISVYEVGRSHMAMTYIDGSDLARFLNSPISPAHATRIVVQVGSALAYAHDAGIIHRDVKPANILVDKMGNAFLADFGLATTLTEARPSQAGTPVYMAPELTARDAHPSPRTDLYALGRTLLEMLIGRPLTSDPANDLAALPETLPAELREVVARAVDPDPSERWPSVRVFVERLQRVELSAYGPPVVLADPVWDAERFRWASSAHQTETVGPDVAEARYRISGCAPVLGEAVGRFREQSGYRELGWSVFCRTDRLGPPDDPASLARATSVVVIFPGLAYTRDSWRHVAIACCRDNARTAVLTAELHGFCDSEYGPELPSKEMVSGRGSMSSVMAWLELLGLRDVPLTLVGHSLSTVPLMSFEDVELGPNVNRLLVAPLFPWVNSLWRYYLFGLEYLDGWVKPFEGVVRTILVHRLRQATRRLEPHLQRSALEELSRYSIPVFARAARGWRDAKGVRGERMRRCKWLCGTEDEIVSKATTLRAAQELGFDTDNLHWCTSRDHYPQLAKRDEPEETSRNVDELVDILNTLLRDVSSQSVGPTESTQQ